MLEKARFKGLIYLGVPLSFLVLFVIFLKTLMIWSEIGPEKSLQH